MKDNISLDRTIDTMARRLIQSRAASGSWEGKLASSALSTATASLALALADKASNGVHGELVRAGLAWLIANQNDDGGWGDTLISFSNLSTTVLCWSALSVGAGYDAKTTDAVSRAERWLSSQIGELDPARLQRAILERYGKDRTFSVPILTVLAIAGKLGSGTQAWRRVPQLPFELAAFPHRWFQWLRLPVVSYALPALVAIGQVRHHRASSRNPLTSSVRSLLRKCTLVKAKSMQPASGGYLEATPLTAFVTMSLIAADLGNHPIIANGLRFLTESVRPDGSWPIDTNLRTWVTTLAVNALSQSGSFPADDRERTLQWLLARQFQEVHPFTHAQPGGWAWTDLSGGVPDADDTSGALLALWNLAGPAAIEPASAGIRWLLDLQNSDGGIPTFCKGWGALPFDQSAADLTAHALEACSTWHVAADGGLQQRILLAATRSLAFLIRQQRTDGSWIPLWFGNQHAPDDANPTYGTSRVVSALQAALVRHRPEAKHARDRGIEWLLRAQNSNGGWGGGTRTQPSIEETSFALAALASEPRARLAIESGVRYLTEITDEGRRTPASPIGLYFARLWYYEELYPLVFALRALSRVRAFEGETSS
jgi:squalene-hopene/tetraprenyl-beta-curcumene cyclase